MRGDRIVVGLELDAFSVHRIVVPVEQHRAEAGEQAVGDVAGALKRMVLLLGKHAAERGRARAHDIHRMRGGRQRLEHGLHAHGKAAHGFQLRLVGGELGCVRQPLVHEQMGDLLELAALGDLEDVVAAIMQVVAGAADR